jgi:alpha-L-fucosidase 2
MLVVDMPSAFGAEATRTVTLGPAIPAAWAGGNVKGLRLRGGGSVDFSWDENGIVDRAELHDRDVPLRVVNRNGDVVAEH